MQLLTGYAKPITALAISPDGARLFSAAKGHTMVWEWDLAQNKVKRKMSAVAHYGIEALTLILGGRSLLAAQTYGCLYVLTLDTGESQELHLREGLRGCGTSVPAVHPGGRLIAVPFLRGVPFHSPRDPERVGYLVHDLQTNQRVEEQLAHNNRIHYLDFSADGTRLATASDDGTVRLWSFPANEAGHVLRHEVAPKMAAFRPDSKMVASAGGYSVFVWDVGTGERIAKLAGHKGNVNAVAYSPDGRYLASVANDGVVILRDAQTNEVAGRRYLEMGTLGAMVWRADSSGLVVGGAKLIALCDLQELLVKDEVRRQPRGDPLSIQGHTKKVEILSYSRDGRFLASASKESIRIHDLAAGPSQAVQRVSFGLHRYGPPPIVSWSPDGSLLALSYPPYYRQSSMIRLCDSSTGAVVREVRPAEGEPRHFSFTPSGELLVIGSTPSGVPTHLTLSTPDGAGRPLQATSPYPGVDFTVWSAVFGAQEERLYLGLGSEVLLWLRTTGESKTVIRQKAGLRGFAVRADERLAVTLGGNSALVWNLPDGSRKLELKHLLQVSGAAFVPGERLLTACYDGVVRLWDLSGGTELHAWDLGMGKIFCLDVSPDFMTFAAGVEKKSRIVLMDVPD